MYSITLYFILAGSAAIGLKYNKFINESLSDKLENILTNLNYRNELSPDEDNLADEYIRQFTDGFIPDSIIEDILINLDFIDNFKIEIVNSLKTDYRTEKVDYDLMRREMSTLYGIKQYKSYYDKVIDGRPLQEIIIEKDPKVSFNHLEVIEHIEEIKEVFNNFNKNCYVESIEGGSHRVTITIVYN